VCKQRFHDAGPDHDAVRGVMYSWRGHTYILRTVASCSTEHTHPSGPLFFDCVLRCLPPPPHHPLSNLSLQHCPDIFQNHHKASL
jgi:hypothetical protein